MTVTNINETDTPLFCIEDRQNKALKTAIRKNIIIYCVIYALTIVLIVINGLADSKNPTGTILVISLAYIPIITNLIQKIRQNTPAIYNVFYFYNNCFVNIDRLSKTTIPYEMAIKAIETKTAFIIKIEPLNSYVILKEIVPKEEIPKFSQFLKSKIKN